MPQRTGASPRLSRQPPDGQNGFELALAKPRLDFSPVRTLKLTLAYDGAAYAGWQWQQGPRTLQGTLEAALAQVTGESIRVTASGRTDAGVHALGQVVSFQTESELSAAVLQKALNAELPDDMAVLDAADVREG